MKTLILISSLLFSLTAFAKELTLSDWQRATVKVNSKAGAWGRPSFSGSGLLVLADEKVYVLTSEHVLFNPGSSEEIVSEKGNDHVSFIKADYLTGMALFISHNRALIELAIRIEDLEANSAPGQMVALGFPVASSSLQTLTGGSFIRGDSPRALIPGIRHFVEATGLPVEYGMSGGALLNYKNSQSLSYTGMISHQFLKRQQGQPTQVRNSSAGDSASAQDILIGIPAAEVIAWFKASRHEKNAFTWKHLIHEDKNVVQYGPLFFTLKEAGPDDSWKIGGGDGGGVGGGDGGGVGGGDGGGVGGGDGGGVGGNKSVTGKFLSIQLTYYRYSLRENEITDPLMAKWLSWIKNSRDVRILYLRPKTGSRLIRITSLDQFLTAWLRDGAEPVAIREPLGYATKDESVPYTAQQVIQQVRAGFAQAKSIERQSWLMNIREVTALANAGMVTSKEVRALLTGANVKAWEAYYNENFDGAVALEGSIQALVETMKALGL